MKLIDLFIDVSRAFCLQESTQHPRCWITRRILSDERQREHAGTRGRGKPHRNWPSRDRVSNVPRRRTKEEGRRSSRQIVGVLQVWEPGEPRYPRGSRIVSRGQLSCPRYLPPIHCLLILLINTMLN